VNDTPGVRSGQSAGGLLAQSDDFGWGKTVLGKVGLESLPAQQLHDQVRLSILLAHVVDGADVGVIQGGGRPGLAQETLVGKVDTRMGGAGRRRTAGALIGVEKAVGDELQSDFAFEPGVQRAIDITHTAGADFFDYPVGPENRS